MFTWRARDDRDASWNARFAGKEAGCLNPSNGYVYVCWNFKQMRAHRLAWFYVHGVWPLQVDHIDLDRSNNQLRNLRESTQSQNRANSPRPVTNTSGVKGVRFLHDRGKWRADIRVDGRKKFLGNFDSRDEAAMVYAAAARQHFGEFARVD